MSQRASSQLHNNDLTINVTLLKLRTLPTLQGNNDAISGVWHTDKTCHIRCSETICIELQTVVDSDGGFRPWDVGVGIVSRFNTLSLWAYWRLEIS